MSKIDWTKSIETLDGQPCKVVEIDRDDPDMPARVLFPDGEDWWLKADGTWKGMAIRNVAEPKNDVPEWAVKRAQELFRNAVGSTGIGYMTTAFAKYIATHEDAPVDPDWEVAGDMCENQFKTGRKEWSKRATCADKTHFSYSSQDWVYEAIKRGRILERGEGR